jgi:hypothetical protein
MFNSWQQEHTHTHTHTHTQRGRERERERVPFKTTSLNHLTSSHYTTLPEVLPPQTATQGANHALHPWSFGRFSQTIAELKVGMIRVELCGPLTITWTRDGVKSGCENRVEPGQGPLGEK